MNCCIVRIYICLSEMCVKLFHHNYVFFEIFKKIFMGISCGLFVVSSNILKATIFQMVEESKVALHIPRTVMPSPRLITKLDNKDIFLRLLLELEFLYNAGKRLPTYMTDSDWMRYIRMASIIERCCFLRQLYESRREMEEKDENKVIHLIPSHLEGCRSRKSFLPLIHQRVSMVVFCSDL